jgi:signal transduction histidine kinase
MSPQRRRVARTLTVLVMVIMAVATVAATLGLRQIVSSQEGRLLNQRADELGLYVSGVTQTVGSQLAEVAVITRLAADPAQGFSAATQLVPGSTTTERALVRRKGNGWSVVAGTGGGLHPGQVLSMPQVVQTVTTAAGSTSFVLSPIFHRGGHKLVIIASHQGAAPGFVVMEQEQINLSSSARTRSGPYSELDVALYDGRQPDPAQLTIANAPLSAFRSGTAREIVHLGDSPFLLEAAARDNLVGGVAGDAQWLVLGLGLGLTILVGAFFDASQRRREYALELVEERTAALNESLDTLRTTQDQLVQSERLAAIGQLASTVGHELRNPLAVISNALYLLRRSAGAGDQEKTTQHLATAEREVSAASLIVSDLLEFSRSRSPMLADVDLSELVDEALSVAPSPSGIEVDWAPPDSPAIARADRDQLRQVILNLITNAYDAMPDGGRLVVRTTAADGTVRIEVSDSGTGMDEATVERIYEPFFTTKTRGVGLGLAVSRRLVEAHSGQLDVTTQPGRGTSFVVDLPGVGGQ